MKLPTLVLGGNTQLRRAALVASTLQYNPANAASRLGLPGYMSWMDRVLDADPRRIRRVRVRRAAEPTEAEAAE